MTHEKVNTVDDFKVGDAYRERRVLDDATVRGFAELSGDVNRIHLDDDYARATRFGARIAHGALLIACLSKALGMHLPGLGSVYLGQEIEFLSPVFVGDEIEIVLTVKAIDREARVISVDCEIHNASKAKLAARGVARIKMARAGL
jgi:3-hydroxybutyryl-CoA dehydratase